MYYTVVYTVQYSSCFGLIELIHKFLHGLFGYLIKTHAVLTLLGFVPHRTPPNTLVVGLCH